MPRVKIYDAWSIPRGVVKIANAVCADYERRAAVLRAGNASEAVLEEYRKLNSAVDAAIGEIDEPRIGEEILRDMVGRRGYEKSQTQIFLCKNSYYARRRMVIYLVARALALV